MTFIQVDVYSAGYVGFKATSFRKWNAETYHPKDKGFWSGLYIAENEKVAKGYAPDCVDQKTGNGEAFIQIVSFNTKVKVITYLDDSFKTGKIDKHKVIEDLRKKGIFRCRQALDASAG